MAKNLFFNPICRTIRIAFLFLFLLLLPCILHSGFSLYNDSYKIVMDNTHGTFTILYPDKDKLIPLLDNENEPFSSFAVLFINKKPYILGSAEGKLLDCFIDSNNIVYKWEIKSIQIRQKLSLIQYGKENFIQIKYLVNCAGKNNIDLLIILDASENKYLLKDTKENKNKPCLLKKQKEIILCKMKNLYHVDKINLPADSIIIHNWPDINNNLEKFCFGHDIDCNKELTDTAAGFFWKDLQKNKINNEIGLMIEKIKPGINLEDIEMISSEPGIIYPFGTELKFTIKNNNLTDINNVSLINKNTNNSDIKILSQPIWTGGNIKAFDSEEIKMKYASLSPIDRILKLNFKMDFSEEDKKFSKDFSYDVLLKKFSPLIDVYIAEKNSAFVFNISVQTNFYFNTADIVIENPDETVVKKISLNPGLKEVPWDSKTDEGNSLIKGSYYFYYIVIKAGNDSFNTPKKVFTTEIEKVETEKQLILRFPAINFNFGSAALKSHAYSILKKITEIIKMTPSQKIRIEGHTDNIGEPDSNLKLSRERAAAVKDYFAGMENMPEYLFDIKGWGHERPVLDNSTDENRARNRRVEIIIEK